MVIKIDHYYQLLFIILHRPERKMRQKNAVMICIFYNYVSSNLLNVLL